MIRYIAAAITLSLVLAGALRADVDVAQFGALANDERDDTPGLQAAVKAAAAQVKMYQPTPGSIYRSTKSTVKLLPGIYRISKQIDFPKSVDISGDGAIVVGMGNHKGFVWNNTGWKATVRGITFDNLTTALEISTGNLDTSRITVEDCNAYRCGTLLDTVSYERSRSTALTLARCTAHTTDYLAKIYTDVSTIDDCWVTHSGHNGAAIVVDSKCTIRGGAFVSGGNAPDRRWIDYYASDEIRTITIDGARVSPEGGGIPLVHCFAKPRKDFAAANGGMSGIYIRQSTVFSGGSMIVLHEVPNQISIENSSGGVCYDRAIIMAKDAKPLDPSLRPMIKFQIDAPSRLVFTGGGQFPAVVQDLLDCLTEVK